MTDTRFAGEPDALDRRVLFALELIDPGSLRLVDSGVAVRAEGLRLRPIVSRSGRFVWLMEGDAWPGAITVTPDGGAFVPAVVPAPPRPADILNATAAERLVRAVLRPTTAYSFDDSVTLLRGRLRNAAARDAPPVVGARMQVAWMGTNERWYPDPGDTTTCPGESLTDAAGEFAVFTRRARDGAVPDIDEHGWLRIRLQVTPADDGKPLVTSVDYPFFDGDTESKKPKGRVPEGRALARDLDIALTQLEPPPGD